MLGALSKVISGGERTLKTGTSLKRRAINPRRAKPATRQGFFERGLGERTYGTSLQTVVQKDLSAKGACT